jgi:predicted acetyltransferase
VTFEVRAAVASEYRTLSETVGAALLSPPRDDEGWAQAEPSWAETSTFAAWDGDACMGSVSQFTVDTTVPGGALLPTGAVSRVGVLPTYRRRGVATALMRRLVDDAVARGFALMSLRASEAVIYERYGFGMAGEFVDATVDPARAKPVRGATAGGSFRFVPRDQILATVEPIYARSMHRRAGTVTRPPSWWRRYFASAVAGSKASFVVAHVDEVGVADGYAHYEVAWNEGGPSLGGGRGEVEEVVAVDASVELALWGYLFDVDLVREWRLSERPVDDVVRTAIRDRRAYRVSSVDDEQWVRLTDVGVALGARTYAPVDGAVTIAVDDPWVAGNRGVWRIDGSGAARIADVEADRADLRVDVAAMSAAYLGGTSWHTLAATGRVAATRPGAVATADHLFAVTPKPWCGSFF